MTFDIYIEDCKLTARKEGLYEGLLKGKKVGLHEGIQKGLQKGKLAEKFKSAKIMLQKGCAFSFISEITGLSIEEITKLNAQG